MTQASEAVAECVVPLNYGKNIPKRDYSRNAVRLYTVYVRCMHASAVIPCGFLSRVTRVSSDQNINPSFLSSTSGGRIVNVKQY